MTFVQIIEIHPKETSFMYNGTCPFANVSIRNSFSSLIVIERIFNMQLCMGLQMSFIFMQIILFTLSLNNFAFKLYFTLK